MLGELNYSPLPFSLFVPCVGCFSDLLSQLATSCMAYGTYPILSLALHLRA